MPETAWDYEGGLLWIPNAPLEGKLTVFQRHDRDVIDYVSSLFGDSVRPASSRRCVFADGAGCLSRREHSALELHRGGKLTVELRLPHNQRIQIAYTAIVWGAESLNGLQTKYSFNYPRTMA